MKNLVEKFISYMKDAVSIDTLSDTKATKYNIIIKKIWKLEDIILERDDYKEIYLEILDLTNQDKYWQLHTFLAESLYLKDKQLCLLLYKLSKGLSARSHDRIKELEKELKQEKKGKGFFGNFFGK